MTSCPPMTASKHLHRKTLAAANARAALTLSDKPTYSVATGAPHMVADCWFVENKWDVGFSASGRYHDTKESAALELQIINCTDVAKKSALIVRLLHPQSHEIEA